MPAVLACTAAAASPALRDLGDLAVVLVGLVASAVLWVAGGREGRSRAWRLFAVAPLLPVAGALLASVLPVDDPLDVVVVRWLPTVPGYGIAVVALLCLAGRSRLRAGGPRAAAEAALFLTSSLVAVRLLVAGPVGDWGGMLLAEQVVLGAAVVVTSATMTAALVLLGVVEQDRRRMAVVLLVGTALLTSGRGLATSAVLADAAAFTAAARFLVVAGLLLLALAVLLDPGTTAPAPRRFSRAVDVGQLLPMSALLVAVAAAGVVRILGQQLDVVTWIGLVLAVVLALVQRWTTACQEHHLSARLRRSEAYFRSLVHSGTDAVVLLDDDLRVLWSSPALERVLGSAAAELVGQALVGAAHPEDQPVLAGALTAGTGAPSLVALRLQDADGVWRCLEAGIADLRDDPDVGAVVLQCRDMTEREARERSLRSVAYTDPMTGLPNRAGMLQLLGERLAAPVADGQEPGTLLVVELDGVAAAREHAGRDVLSTVVAEIGRRLRATVRGEDVVARMGGGTFAVLAEGQGADADRLAGRILSVVEQPIVTAAGILDLTADVGLVELDEGLAVEDLLVHGDLAVRAAAATGPGTAQRYRADLGEAAARHERLREDLRAARSRGELFLLFQPVVALADQRVAGIEAMLRWRHPTLGEIPPAEFLPIAEQSGLTGELQRFALEEATKAAAGLPESASDVRVAVDAPAGYVATGAMIADVEQALRASGLAPERLVLEIGAATVTSPEERDGLDVSTLRLMGVHVALAGFGGDSSMLTHLTKLPIDTVKLDRAFVSRIDRDPKTRALCESVVGIGRALGMSVVAEGVETAAQLAVLSGFGCDFAQGFLLARPMPLEQLTRLFSAGAGALWPGLVASR